MPLYSYKCTECEAQTQVLVSKKDKLEEIPCESCGKPAQYQLPQVGDMTVYDTADKNRNKKVRRGVTEMLKKRMVEHNRKYLVPERVDQFGLEEAQRLGLIDNKKGGPING